MAFQSVECQIFRLPALRAKNELDQALHLAMGLHRVAERELAVDAVNIAATDSFPLENAAGHEFRDDLLHRTFRDADCGHHIPQAHFRVLGKAQQDVRVVGEERPTGADGAWGNIFFHFGVDG